MSVEHDEQIAKLRIATSELRERVGCCEGGLVAIRKRLDGQAAPSEPTALPPPSDRLRALLEAVAEVKLALPWTVRSAYDYYTVDKLKPIELEDWKVLYDALRKLIATAEGI